MSTQIQSRRGTTAQHSSFTGAAGEITVDTDKNVVVVHDGSTAGGHPLQKASSAVSYSDATANFTGTLQNGGSNVVVDSDIGSTVQAYDADNVVADTAPTFTATIQTTERTITAGAFDLSTGNHWTCGAITVPAPTNATAGTSGLIRITAGSVVWNSVFKFPGGSAPTIASFPAIIPFYVQSSSVILMGNVVEGIS